MTSLSDLRVKIFADGADLKQIEALAENPLVRGFTTNPTLMRKAGVTDYMAFAKDAIKIVGKRPISFEVFADDPDGMEQQARVISEWGPNVYVKIPITNTKAQFVGGVLRKLAQAGVKLNVTAILTMQQIKAATDFLGGGKHYISVFAGRIADTGRDPAETIVYAKSTCHKSHEIIWASPREVLNIWEANIWGCDIITVSSDLLAKLSLAGKSLEEYSLETVRMFHDDAQKAGYTIAGPASYGGSAFG